MRSFHAIGRITTILGVAFGLSACAGGSVSPPASVPAAGNVSILARRDFKPPAGYDKIKHVVIIVQENRSFDNLFQGYPGADTQSYGYNQQGQQITLQPVGLETTWDLEHDSTAFFDDCNGTGSFPGTDCRMNGFDQEYVGCEYSNDCPNANPPYSYVPHSETVPYFTLASEYVLADRMFASNFDESSFISHQYIIAGQASSAVNFPFSSWGCEGGASDEIATVTQQRQIPGGYIQACFDEKTLGDELDQAGLSWKFYTSQVYGDGGLWAAYQAIRHIYYGPDWSKDVVTPQTQFFTDVTNGNLPVVSWVTPTCENSDHAGCGSNTGPAWVASLVNAIGESKYWKSTAIFLFWDDPGGWYDHVPPKLVDYDGLGLRIPLVMISAYAKAGYVTHVHYEHGSILRFIEDRFGLGRLSASDTRANNPANDAFDFSQPPRPFVSIPSAHDRWYFMHQRPDLRPPDTE